MPKKAVKKTEAETARPDVTVPLESAERFFKTFERSARRWEMIVYPGMVLVIVFMAYGFYLIYNLTSDMREMVSRFDDPEITSNLTNLTKNIETLNSSISLMARRVASMSDDTAKMSTSTTSMSRNTADMAKLMQTIKYMRSMDKELRKMNQSVYMMNGAVRSMSNDMRFLRRDMGQMNRNVSRPLNMMNSFMPF